MPAVITDQFRILNAENFIESISNTNNSYYAFLGLSNPGNDDPSEVGFGRTTTWDATDPTIPSPIDNLQYTSHYRNTILFGKRITDQNARRVVRKVSWANNTAYDIYRHDYSITNKTKVTDVSRLYDANYYVITSEFKVYICISNGSDGTSTTIGKSLFEPTSTDPNPTGAGDGSDNYKWKYLFTVSPQDVIKFDSTEYIVLPNNWLTSSDVNITTVRNNAITSGQIKKVFIENGGDGYTDGTYDDVEIFGDGTGGKVSITVQDGKISEVVVSSGGSGYTFGIINFSGGNNNSKLIPIIPPARGHGDNIYEELGADRVLLYARFDDSTKDFPTDSKFAQVGIIKNPKKYTDTGVGDTFTDSTFSSLFSIKMNADKSSVAVIGGEITQSNAAGTAKGYIASYDKETDVLKYYQDRSLYFGNNFDQTDNPNKSDVVKFLGNENNQIVFPNGDTGVVDITLNDSFIISGDKRIVLGSSFKDGLSNPDINRNTGTIIYIDNRALVTRDLRQKEDVKIILEF